VEDRKAGTRLSETIERIRWRLWHGQVRRGLDLIGETMATLEATRTSPAGSAALKVARLLGELETYVCGQCNIFIDYATASRREEPISTAATESTVQWLLHRRMNAQQQMHWTPRGASDAQGPMRGDEWYARTPSHRRRTKGSSSVPA
jgi:hypothetical protein